MDGPLPLRGSISIPAAELQWRFSRSSGPGGQHVNTSSTAAEVRFDVAGSQALPPPLKARALQRLEGRLAQGVLIVRAEEHRSQWRNREGAREKLREILLQATAPPPRPRKATKPTKGSRERRLTAKRQRSEIKRGRSWRGGD
jgi:ribosome-associated protein